jgi:hypothetical protein
VSTSSWETQGKARLTTARNHLPAKDRAPRQQTPLAGGPRGSPLCVVGSPQFHLESEYSADAGQADKAALLVTEAPIAFTDGTFVRLAEKHKTLYNPGH